MRRHLIFFIVLGVIGLGVFIALYDTVFPTAALRPQITRRRAAEISKRYLAARGFNVEGYKHATLFSVHDEQASFLERTWGIARFNEEITQNPYLAPWRFESRFFRPLEKEEFLVGVNTEGRVVAFNHLIEETAPGAHRTKEEARVYVEKFFESDLKADPSAYEEKEYHEGKLSARTDHEFTYELRNSEIFPEDARDREPGSQRIGVLVQGNTIGAFERFVFVPESFIRDQMEEDASGTLYVIIAGIAQILLLIAGFTVLLRGYKQEDLSSRPFYWIAAALVALSLVGALTFLDELYMAYPTTTPWTNYIAVSVLVLVAALAVTTAVEVLIAGISGERLTRAVFPHANDIGTRALGDPEAIWTRTLIGAGSGLAFLGYVAVFYYIGTRYLGIWSPIAPEITSYMGSGIPFLMPFVLSLTAAVTEEFTFRYLGVSLAKRYLKHTALALVIPAVVWAFLHSTYPVYPLYVRGIELTVAGIFLGYLFMRYGILTVIVAHYIINAILFSVPLLRSADAYLRASGTVAIGLVVAIPIVSILANRRRKKFSLQND